MSVPVTESCAYGVDEPIPNQPCEVKVEVAVAPTASVLAEKLVVDAPPLNESKVDVALFGNSYPMVLVITPVAEL